MSNGDDKPKGAGKTNGRKRRAVRPPTIDARAEEIETPPNDPEPTEGEPDSSTQASRPAETENAPSPTDQAEPVDPAAEEAGTPEEAEASADAAAEAPSDESPAGEQADAEPAADTVDADKTGEAEVAAEAGETAEAEETGTAGDPGGAGESETAAQPPLPTARRASLIGAGLVGALIALGIYLGLYYGGVLPRDRTTMIDSLIAQGQELGRRVAALESSAARTAKRDLAKEVSELQTALKELGSDPKNTVLRRVRDLEAQIGEFAKPAGDEEGTIADTVQSRLTALEDALSKAGDSVGSAVSDAETRFTDIVKRIETLESRPAQAPAVTANGEAKNGDAAAPADGAPLAALSERIAALDTQMQALSKTVSGMAETGGAAAQEQVAKLESELAAVRGELDKLGGTVSKTTRSVDDKLAAFRKSIDERDTGASREVARTTAGALALTALVKSADAGEPYAGELEVLEPLVDDKADLTALKAHADKGVPDLQSLSSSFAKVANAILTAGDGADAGLVDTLMSSARSLVRVRPVGKVEGEGRGAIVARIEAALEAGDLKTAETEWASLDETAKAVSQDWADGLKARIAVNQALAGLSASLTASLSETAAPDTNGNAGAKDAGKTGTAAPEQN